MKKIFTFLTMLLIFTCSLKRESIRYELPPKQADDDPAKLAEVISFKNKEAEKLYKEVLEGKAKDTVANLKKVTQLEPNNPLGWRWLSIKSDRNLSYLEKANSIFEKNNLKDNTEYAWIVHDYAEHYAEKENFFKAEEYYDSSLKIFERLGEKEDIQHLLEDAGKNLVRYANSCSNYKDRPIEIEKSKIRKAREYFLKSKSLLDKEKLKIKDDSIYISERSIDKELLSWGTYQPNEIDFYEHKVMYLNVLIGETYRLQWLFETGKPEPEGQNPLPLKYTNYEDYNKAKSYFEEILSKIKGNDKGTSTAEYDSSVRLAMLNFKDDNLARYNCSITQFTPNVDSKFQDRLKANLYYQRAGELGVFALKKNMLANAANVFPETESIQNRRKAFSAILKDIESYDKWENSNFMDVFEIKMLVGNSIEQTETEEDVLAYYKNIMEDKRVSVEFYKKNDLHPSYNPRSRFSLYYAKKQNFCEALKWERESIAYSKLVSKDKPDTYLLEKYTHKCELTKGIEQYNSKMEPAGKVVTYFKNRWLDLADIFTLEVFGLGIGAMVGVGPMKAGLQFYGTTDFKGEKDKFDSYKFEGVLLLDFQNRVWEASEDQREGFFRRGSERNKFFAKKDKLPIQEYGKISANVGDLYAVGFEFNFFELADFFTGLVGYDLLEDDLPANKVNQRKNKFASNDLNDEYLSAVYSGNLEKVKDALLKGANINAELDYGYGKINPYRYHYEENLPALTLAIKKGFNDLALYLVEKGANVKHDSYDPLVAAVDDKYAASIPLIEKLLQKGADKDAGFLNAVTEYNNLNILNLFLKYGANVNAKDSYGRTALHKAVGKENTLFLIEKKANVNTRDNGGETPLIYTSKLEKAKVLVENKADINAKDKNGKNALQSAIEEKKDSQLIQYYRSIGMKE